MADKKSKEELMTLALSELCVNILKNWKEEKKKKKIKTKDLEELFSSGITSGKISVALCDALKAHRRISRSSSKKVEEEKKEIDEKYTQAVTLTFGDRAESHFGMQILGEQADEGFDLEMLLESKKRFEDKGCQCELVNLGDAIDIKTDEAYVLVIRKGVNAILSSDDGKDDDSLYEEQMGLTPDKKAKMRGRVCNKRARYNLCFGKHSQESDFYNNKGTVVSFVSVPILKRIRKRLHYFCGETSKKLWIEGNYYYNPKICGIGFHGDAERRKVIAIRLGVSIPLHYQWFHHSSPVGERVKIMLNHGDMYIMSDKAVGYDWKKPSKYTLRHAAGCAKYTTIKK